MAKITNKKNSRKSILSHCLGAQSLMARKTCCQGCEVTGNIKSVAGKQRVMNSGVQLVFFLCSSLEP